ncbi:hypothetical protein AVEN_71583-1 [Araneus ventricosus]|uniref:Uncharacterized protein n=1 Tax=Araneus ventricosus TaxID=182803 RepID=A0A4Y2T6B3_ARAVE|nr:hypothetical protein AVEN_71583-1 [Araneus ventricosus]
MRHAKSASSGARGFDYSLSARQPAASVDDFRGAAATQMLPLFRRCLLMSSPTSVAGHAPTACHRRPLMLPPRKCCYAPATESKMKHTQQHTRRANKRRAAYALQPPKHRFYA